MAKSPISELFGTLRNYANKLSDGERTPAEIATALNDWAQESRESIRTRVHEEVEAAVSKMGFVKRDEFDALAAQVAALSGKSDSKKSVKDKKSDKKKSDKKAEKK